MRERIILAILLAVVCVYGSVWLVLLTAWVRDKIVARRAEGLNRAAYEEAMKGATHLSTVRGRLRAANHDQRLWGLMRTVKTPLVDADGDPVDKKGNPIPEGSDPIMVTAKDDEGKPVREYRFDTWNEDYCNPHLEEKMPLSVDPGPRVPSWPRIYVYARLVAAVLGLLLSIMGLWAGLVVPFGIGMWTTVTMLRQGQACMESNQDTWGKIETIYTKYFGQPPEGKTVEDMVQINGWEAPGESQAIANATTYASEIGKTEEAERIIHPTDKRGRPVKPRISRFRTVPSSMIIRFSATFMEESIPAFMNHLNQSLGGRTVEWVAEREVQRGGKTVMTNGWDMDKQTVWLHTLPPLPTIASLPEDLDTTPWNVIRLGRSVNGEVVWDLSGQGFGALMQKNENGELVEVRDKKGNIVPDTVHRSEQAGITTPMSLVPLDVDTPVWVLSEDDGSNDDSPDDDGSSTRGTATVPAGSDASTGSDAPSTIIIV